VLAAFRQQHFVVQQSRFVNIDSTHEIEQAILPKLTACVVCRFDQRIGVEQHQVALGEFDRELHVIGWLDHTCPREANLVQCIDVFAHHEAQPAGEGSNRLAVAADVYDRETRDAAGPAHGHVMNVAATGVALVRVGRDPRINTRHENSAVDGFISSPYLHALKTVDGFWRSGGGGGHTLFLGRQPISGGCEGLFSHMGRTLVT